MKIGKLVVSIVFILLSVCLIMAVFTMLHKLPQTNTIGDAVSKIVTIPIFVIVLVLNYSCSLGAVGSSISAISSESKAVMIIAIVCLVLSLVILGFNIFSTIQFVNIL